MTAATEPLPETAEFLRALLAAADGENASGFDAFMEKMSRLCAFLYETNEKFNLTALPRESFWSRHAADSLSAVKAFPRLGAERLSLCDLGCGAGFPALVLASAFPELSVTAVDSTGKKAAFVKEAAALLRLGNLTALQARGIELGHKAPFAGAFDVVSARAVASAEKLVKESFGLLKKGGTLLVYRTPGQLDGERAFLDSCKRLSWSASEVFLLPGNAGTRLFLLAVKR